MTLTKRYDAKIYGYLSLPKEIEVELFHSHNEGNWVGNIEGVIAGEYMCCITYHLDDSKNKLVVKIDKDE